jgi:hypothetical protein
MIEVQARLAQVEVYLVEVGRRGRGLEHDDANDCAPVIVGADQAVDEPVEGSWRRRSYAPPAQRPGRALDAGEPLQPDRALGANPIGVALAMMTTAAGARYNGASFLCCEKSQPAPVGSSFVWARHLR